MRNGVVVCVMDFFASSVFAMIDVRRAITAKIFAVKIGIIYQKRWIVLDALVELAERIDMGPA